MVRKKPILCVDFDGVVHSYTSPWVDEATIVDGPVKGALRWLWKATEWFEVIIYSSRSKSPAGRAAMEEWMRRHGLEEFGPEHPMSDMMKDPFGIAVAYPIAFAAEKPPAFLTIDDRAVCFEGDWSELDPCAMLEFKPWNKRPKVEPLEPYAA